MSKPESEVTDHSTDDPEGSVVIDVLGDHPKTRILLAVLTDPDRDYNMSEIAELADTDRSTVYRHIDDLLDVGVITQTRKAGNAPMYQLNQENGAAQAFGTFEWEVIKAVGEHEA